MRCLLTLSNGRVVVSLLSMLLLYGAIALVAPPDVQADVMECHQGPGGQLFAAGGQVEVEILRSNSDNTNDIFLFKTGQPPLLIGSDDQTTRLVHLGAFPAGSEILFGIKVRETGNIFKIGPASRNFDGVVHARVECITEAIVKIYFEDQAGGGDNDFNDAIIQVRIGRKRGITSLIEGATSCPPTGVKDPFWGTFGQRTSLDSNAGERLQLTIVRTPERVNKDER